MPGVRVRDKAPDFIASCIKDKLKGNLSLSDYSGKYVVLLFFPLNFTFVCPTEISLFSDRHQEFLSINTQIICCSCDSSFGHLAWINTPRTKGGLGDVNFPIISDMNKKISTAYGILTDESVPLRALFIISPKGIILQVNLVTITYLLSNY